MNNSKSKEDSVNKLIQCGFCNQTYESGWRGYFCGAKSTRGLTEVYAFGVYACYSINILLHSLHCSKLWGFDSFIGLPVEYNEEITQSDWKEGGFDARKYFNVESVENCVNLTYKKLAPLNHFNVQVELIPGFYEKVLTDQLVIDKQMKPAFYIDIDCDLYSSTKTALHWMCRNKLITSGTFIGFDDWGGTPNFDLCLDGESKAFREIVQEFDLKTKLLFNDDGKYPHAQRIYKIE